MSKTSHLIKNNGYVLVSDFGIQSCGFEFNYSHHEFDGCRIGQLAPLMYAQSKLNDVLQAELIAPQNVGYETYLGHSDDAISPNDLAEAFIAMLLNQLPYKRGGILESVFIGELISSLYSAAHWRK